jgi:hypothetical protein
MEAFYIKYRKLLTIAVILCFLYFPFELYRGVEIVASGKTGEGLGAILNACVILFSGIYFLIQVRKVSKGRSEEIMS